MIKVEIEREEIVNAFVQALGREGAEALMKIKLRDANLPNKKSYNLSELTLLVEEFRKEGTLIRTLASLILSTFRLGVIEKNR